MTRPLRGLILILLLTAVVGLFLFAFSDEYATQTGRSIQELVINRQNYKGRNITVAGPVTTVINPGAFVIGGPEYGQGETIVVILENPATANLKPGDLVLIRGKFQDFDRPALSNELSRDLSEAEFATYQGQPVVVARSLSVTPKIAMTPEETPDEDQQE